MDPNDAAIWDAILRAEIKVTDSSIGAIQSLNRCMAQAVLWKAQTEEWQDLALKQIDSCFREIW